MDPNNTPKQINPLFRASNNGSNNGSTSIPVNNLSNQNVFRDMPVVKNVQSMMPNDPAITDDPNDLDIPSSFPQPILNNPTVSDGLSPVQNMFNQPSFPTPPSSSQQFSANSLISNITTNPTDDLLVNDDDDGDDLADDGVDYNDPANNPYLRDLQAEQVDFLIDDYEPVTSPVAKPLFPQSAPTQKKPQMPDFLNNAQNDPRSTQSSDIGGQLSNTPFSLNQINANSIPTQNPQSQNDPTNNMTQGPGNVLSRGMVGQYQQNQMQNQMGSSSMSPEYKASFPVQKEQSAETALVEELKNIEKPKVEAKTEQQLKDYPVEDSSQKLSTIKSTFGDLHVYGYKVPQKILNLTSQGSDSVQSSFPINSAKRWLVVLVGRIIKMKIVSQTKV